MSHQPHEEQKPNSIRRNGNESPEKAYDDAYEEYLLDLEEDIKESELNGEFDLGEVITTWREDGEIEIIFGPMQKSEGTLLARDAAPELNEEVLSNWDVLLRYRDGRVEVMFGNVQKKRVLPDDDPHFFEGPMGF